MGDKFVSGHNTHLQLQGRVLWAHETASSSVFWPFQFLPIMRRGQPGMFKREKCYSGSKAGGCYFNGFLTKKGEAWKRLLSSAMIELVMVDDAALMSMP